MQQRRLVPTLVLPDRDMGKVCVISQSFALFGLKFRTEMTTTRFITHQRILTDQFRKLHKISHTACLFQFEVQIPTLPRHSDVLPEFRAQLRNALQSFFESFGISGHPAFFPHEMTQLTMEGGDGTMPPNFEQILDS